MTEQNKQKLEKYREACDILNAIQKKMDENTTEDGHIIDYAWQSDLESNYYSAMKECDYYIWHFSKLGLDANQLLENEHENS